MTSGIRHSDLDKSNDAFDRAEFALSKLQKRTGELLAKLTAVRTQGEVETLHLESIELVRQLGLIREAVHVGSLTPHLRLISVQK
jgi:hypothetical protein